MNRITIQQFIAKHRVRASARWADDNPHMQDMPAGSSHWRVVLRRGNRQLTVPFSQGPAICHEPTAADVLDCLASDAAGFENARDFEDWASEYGYDTDSRKAERTYAIVEKQSDRLMRFLGSEAYDELLWHVDRQ